MEVKVTQELAIVFLHKHPKKLEQYLAQSKQVKPVQQKENI